MCHAAAVRDRLQHLLGEQHLVGVRAEHPSWRSQSARVQRPGAHAAEQERGAELGLEPRVSRMSRRARRRGDPRRGAGIDHPGDRVVPGILLGAGPGRPRGSPGPGPRSPGSPGARPPTRVVFIRRDAARSAGPKLIPCIRGLAVAISSRLTTPSPVSRIAWTRIASRARPWPPAEPATGRRNGCPRGPRLGHHDYVELVADLSHERGQIVEYPGRLQAVDRVHSWVSPSPSPCPPGPGPPGRSLRSTGTASSRLPSRMSTVGRCRAPWHHLLVGEVQESGSSGRPERDLHHGRGRADGQGLSEVAGVSHCSVSLSGGRRKLAERAEPSETRSPVALGALDRDAGKVSAL